MNHVKIFEDLVLNKKCEIADGVFLSCGNEINIKVFNSNGTVKITIGSPSLSIEIHKMGMIALSRILKPTIESVTITKDSYIISINNAPDIEVKRDTSNS